MKKEKRNILDTIKNVFKKQTQIEKNKRQDKKKQKKNRPRGYRARRFGAITFWVLFSFMFLFVFVNMFSSSSSGDEEIIETKDTKVTSQEGVEFTKSFVLDLFNTVSKEDTEKREERLEEYVTENVDINEVLKFGDDTSIDLKKDNIVLKDVEESENEKARHIYKIKLTTSTKLSSEEIDRIEDAKDKDKVIDEMLSNDESILEIKDEEKVRDIDLYIVVPLAFNKDFIVYDYPSYTYLKSEIDNEEEDTIENLLDELKEVKDSDQEANMEAFLETFFVSFSNDTEDKLSYILEDEKYKNGLNESLTFSEIKELDIYEGNDSDLIIDVDVEFVHEETNIETVSNYVLVVKEKEQRYVVKHVNNDQYLYEFIYGVQEAEETEDDSEKSEEDSNSEKKSNETDIDNEEDEAEDEDIEGNENDDEEDEEDEEDEDSGKDEDKKSSKA